VKQELSLEREIVRYLNVSLHPILKMNENIEQHIRKKTHKPNTLKFWIEGGVIYYLSAIEVVYFMLLKLVLYDK